MAIKLLLFMVLVPILFAQDAKQLKRDIATKLLSEHSCVAKGKCEQLVIIVTPGFPGKPVELTWFAVLTRSKYGKKVSIRYYSIPATTMEQENLELSLKKAISTNFTSCLRFSVNTDKHQSTLYSIFDVIASGFKKTSTKRIDADSIVVATNTNGRIIVFDEGYNIETPELTMALNEFDRIIGPHRNRLLKATVESVFGSSGPGHR